jgi:hypothetical protein
VKTRLKARVPPPFKPRSVTDGGYRGFLSIAKKLPNLFFYKLIILLDILMPKKGGKKLTDAHMQKLRLQQIQMGAGFFDDIADGFTSAANSVGNFVKDDVVPWVSETAPKVGRFVIDNKLISKGLAGSAPFFPIAAPYLIPAAGIVSALGAGKGKKIKVQRGGRILTANR